MSSRKLSSEEVEALMDGLKSSAHDALLMFLTLLMCAHSNLVKMIYL